jgi:regulator of protease activity HflC (stomatin/prohibitin superfamily)
VEPGNVGVVSTFNFVDDKELDRGTHMINPFAEVTTFSIKKQKLDFHQAVPTIEGLIVNLEVAMLYAIDPKKVVLLFTNVGADFEDKVLRPELASAVRSFTARAPAEALYNATREVIQGQIKQHMIAMVSTRGIIVQDVLLKDIQLPALLNDAINLKAQAQQDANKMEYVIEKETQEAARKKIEAEGIAKFQSTVSQGISAELLQWKGIEATEKFATQKHTKVVMLGSSGANMPLILNGEGTR